MVIKIISGGQTGADRAGLDVAIEIGIPHSGWIPKGRLTEEGKLPVKYKLKETKTANYPQRTELNVIDSDATIIFTHGKLTGGSALTQSLAKKHDKPCLHIDFDGMSESSAIEIIKNWINEKKIKILNVAGSRASKDPDIYDCVKRVLWSALYLLSKATAVKQPDSIKEAVDIMISILPLKEKTKIAGMEETELSQLHLTLGKYIRNQFGIWAGNKALLQECRDKLNRHDIHEDESSSLIIKELWERLQNIGTLRVVK